MNRKKFIWIGLSVLAALAVGFFWGIKKNDESLGVQVVATYRVPAERVDEVKSSLNRLFWQKDAEGTLGSAQVFGNGLMLVRAPVGYQKGVSRLIEELGSEKPQPRASIRLDYWVIVGYEDKKSNIDSFPALNTVLSAIDKVDGPRRYRVLEHLASHSASGQEVEIVGSASKAKSVTVSTNNNLGLRLEFKSKLGEVKSDTQIKPGEFLILGQNAVAPDVTFGGEKIASVGSTNVYYVVHAEVTK